MPRTKRPVAKKKPERLADGEEASRRKYLDEIVDMHKQALEQRCEIEIKNIQMAFKILQASLGNETLHKTIGQMKSELVLKEIPKSSSCVRNVSQDDGYLTESSALDSGGRDARPTRVSRSASRLPDHSAHEGSRTGGPRRSRSTEVARHKTARPTRPPTSFKTPAAYKSLAAYKTPACNTNSKNNFPPITPKVVPNTPLTVLRRPRQGEMVVSMSGSPLMVPSMQADHKANCNIPLYDGTMLSLQPEHMRKSNTFIPFSLMDRGVLRQLETLKDNLDTVLKLSHKNKS